jgi:hypothetical protein
MDRESRSFADRPTPLVVALSVESDRLSAGNSPETRPPFSRPELTNNRERGIAGPAGAESM